MKSERYDCELEVIGLSVQENHFLNFSFSNCCVSYVDRKEKKRKASVSAMEKQEYLQMVRKIFCELQCLWLRYLNQNLLGSL